MGIKVNPDTTKVVVTEIKFIDKVGLKQKNIGEGGR